MNFVPRPDRDNCCPAQPCMDYRCAACKARGIAKPPPWKAGK